MKERSDFTHETYCDLDRIVGGAFKEEDKDLKGNDLVSDSLVDEVGYEGGSGVTNDLVVELACVYPTKQGTPDEETVDS